MLLEMTAVNTWRTGDILDIVFFGGGGMWRFTKNSKSVPFNR